MILAVLGPPFRLPSLARRMPGGGNLEGFPGRRCFWKSARKSTGPEATRRNDVGMVGQAGWAGQGEDDLGTAQDVVFWSHRLRGMNSWTPFEGGERGSRSWGK